MEKTKPSIGIIGGMGPQASLDLSQKVLEETVARIDQDHIAMILISRPASILDRTEFVLGLIDENPGTSIAQVAIDLAHAGATVAGIPCNSAHCPPIFNLVQDLLKQNKTPLRLLHMIKETVLYLQAMLPPPARVGILSTTGIYKVGVYRKALQQAGYAILEPDPETQTEVVHAAIYDTDYGIKAHSHPVTEKARMRLETVLDDYLNQAADMVILGCTELPLCFPETHYKDVRLLDPTRILARALIRETQPEKLRPIL